MLLSLSNCRFLLGAFITLCIGLQVYQTEAGYILELELRNFSNPHRRLHNGDCCDGTTLEQCSRPCTVAFVFCWKNYGSTSTSVDESNCISRGSTSVYGNQDTITFTNGVLPSTSEKPPNNPLIMMGDVWPGAIQMFVRVMNDNGSKRMLVDHIRVRERLPPNSATGFEEYIGDNAVITAEFRLMCTEYFYPPNCSTFCEPHNDFHSGHYDCEPVTGAKICKPGYTDPASNCTQCATADGCSIQNGYCNRPNECICHTGYGGPLCQQDIDVCGHVLPCLRGTCINTGPDSYYCECPTNYHGDNCQLQNGDDIPTVMCSDSPCENGGTCISINNTYTCLCRDGYEGEHCSDDVDMCRHISPCYNGATCINSGANAYHCQCTSGYNGTHCEDTATGSETQTSHELPHLPIIAGSVGGALLLITLIVCIGFYTMRRQCLAHKRKHPTLQATSHLYTDVSAPMSPTTSSTLTSSHQIASELQGFNQISDSSTTTEPGHELVNPVYTETEHYYSVINPTGRQDMSFEYNSPSQYANMESLSSHHYQQEDKMTNEKKFNRREPSPYYNVIDERSHDNRLSVPASNHNHHQHALKSRLAPEDTYSQPVDAIVTAHQLPLYHVLEHNSAASNTSANTSTMNCSPPPVYQVLEEPPELVKAPISTMCGESKSQHPHSNNGAAAAPVLPDYDDIDD